MRCCINGRLARILLPLRDGFPAHIGWRSGGLDANEDFEGLSVALLGE
jgi:hypothetical protein